MPSMTGMLIMVEVLLLGYDACFLSGLVKIETVDVNGAKQAALETKGGVSLYSK